jgi:hypothetical protein
LTKDILERSPADVSSPELGEELRRTFLEFLEKRGDLGSEDAAATLQRLIFLVGGAWARLGGKPEPAVIGDLAIYDRTLLLAARRGGFEEGREKMSAELGAFIRGEAEHAFVQVTPRDVLLTLAEHIETGWWQELARQRREGK